MGDACLFSPMTERAYWHSDPDALIADAAQAMQAKRELAGWLGCSWEQVDSNLGPALLEAVRHLPGRDQQRRREDRKLLGWVSRLVSEIAPDDPYRTQIHRRLREKV